MAVIKSYAEYENNFPPKPFLDVETSKLLDFFHKMAAISHFVFNEFILKAFWQQSYRCPSSKIYVKKFPGTQVICKQEHTRQ